MSQLDLFSIAPVKPHKYWTQFPGHVGIYYQSEDDKEAARKSIDQWRQEKPEEAARLDRILQELRDEIQTLKNK